MREFFSDAGAALAVPYRQFFRWNAAKLTALAHFFAWALLLSLPGLVLMAVSAMAVQARVSQKQVAALASAVDPQATLDAARAVGDAAGALPVLGLLAATALIVLAVAFAAGFASQALYQDVLLRAARGERMPAVSPLWRSWLAWRKYAAVFAWTALGAAAALVPFAAVDRILARPVFDALGLNGPGGGHTAYWLFSTLWYGAFSAWAAVRLGFAPLAMLCDLRADRSGWSYVAQAWKLTGGRAFWGIAARWVAWLAAAYLFGKAVALGVAAAYFWFVPAAALGLAAWGAWRGRGSAAGRWAGALGAVALFVLAYLLAVLAYQALILGPLGYLGSAYLPDPVALAAAFAFLGLGESFRAVLWRRLSAA